MIIIVLRFLKDFMIRVIYSFIFSILQYQKFDEIFKKKKKL
jgi:hypothetical protein